MMVDIIGCLCKTKINRRVTGLFACLDYVVQKMTKTTNWSKNMLPRCVCDRNMCPINITHKICNNDEFHAFI